MGLFDSALSVTPLGMAGNLLGQGVNAIGNAVHNNSSVAVDPATLAQQQAFVQALQTQAAGGGPSAATQLLSNNAQQTAANAQAMAAGQRGVNPGLAMRGAQQAGVQANQQAAGQATAARMQEQLNAQGMLGQQLSGIQGQNLQAQGLNAGIAQNNANANAKLIGGVMQGGGSAAMAAMAQGGMIMPRMAQGGMIMPRMAQGGMPPISASLPTVGNGGGMDDLNFSGAGGGKKKSGNDDSSDDSDPLQYGVNSGLDSGPQVESLSGPIQYGNSAPQMGPLTQAGGFTRGQAAPSEMPPMEANGGAIMGPKSRIGQMLRMHAPRAPGQPMLAKGGKVDALVSKGEVYVPPSKVHAKDPIKAGNKIPGKPEFKGNDYRNDVVPKKLEKGGIVIPNKVLQGKDPHAAAAKFVAAVLAKHGGPKAK